MDYVEIYDDIVSIMKNDSATCEDMGAGDFKKYREFIRNDMSEREFTFIVKKYLASFGLEGHLSFWCNDLGTLGIEVMRFENSLYVTKASGNSSLKYRDRIIEVDGQTIETCALRNQEFLMGETEERQGILWNQILMFANEVTVVREGIQLEIPLNLTKGKNLKSKYTYQDLGDKILLLRLSDFADEAAIRSMYEECRALLDTCENLIIDVRNNGGGSDTAFAPLFAYCYPEGKKAGDFIPKSPPVTVNYSDRNCEMRLKMIEEFFSEGISEDVLPVIEQMKEKLIRNKGKGMAAEESQAADIGLEVCGRKFPEHVWIITDQGCASSGDAFVRNMSYSPKVRIIGRPTLGILDYSNCSIETWNQFQMMYPTSRDGRLDTGDGMGHRGVPVDHYIPWTPLHLEQDVDMEYVLRKIAAVNKGFN